MILHATHAQTWLPQVTPSAARAFLEEDRLARYVAERGLLFRVCTLGDRPVGLVDWEDDTIHALHVAPAYSGRGVGTALMDVAEASIAAAGFRDARLETDTFNLRAQGFYAARGYREVDRYPDRVWNSGITTLLLAKKLG